MDFLTARRLAGETFPGKGQHLALLMSGEGGLLPLYLRAEAARRQAGLGLSLPVAFDGLRRLLLEGGGQGEDNVLLLYPWDFSPVLDWRQGGPDRPVTAGEVLAEAGTIAGRLGAGTFRHILYVPARLPPVFVSPREQAETDAGLRLGVARAGGICLSGDSFSLTPWLASGIPFSGETLPGLAAGMATCLLDRPPATRMPKKIILTDMDNTLWGGQVAEDRQLACAPDHEGAPFFLYQKLLKRLAAGGALLAAVSRNDPGDVTPPLENGAMPLTPGDFTAIRAGYGRKSATIAGLAGELGLALSDAVLVDDNDLELAEVALALPMVTCLRFPAAIGEMPEFLDRLAGMFAPPSGAGVTAEDRNRTELYRLRREAEEARARPDFSLDDWLMEQQMVLRLREAGTGTSDRPVQLLGRTSQFNLNGRRLSVADMTGLLRGGMRLFAASLRDRSGDHGEVCALLVGPDGCAEAWALSCRVFGRRVEEAFLLHFLQHPSCRVKTLRYQPTARNEPLRMFLGNLCGREPEPGLLPVGRTWQERLAPALAFFSIEGPGETSP